MLRSPIVFIAAVLTALTLGIVSPSLASHPANTTDAGPTITGTFDSNWGPVHLEQSGARVSGTYECCGRGRIAGTLENGVLHYTWDQPGATGRGRWDVRKGGNELTGTWGHGESETSGGPWNLRRRAHIAR